MSAREDIEFLKVQLKKRQKWYEESFHLAPSDLLPEPDVPVTSPDEERIARLADENGFDGSLFRHLTKDHEPLSLQSIRRLEKKIETIPRIIAKIEKSAEKGQKVMPAKEEEESVELPSHYVTCVEISGIISKRSDSIARTLRAHQYPVIKKAGKNYCDPQHAAALFKKWKKYQKKYQENE